MTELINFAIKEWPGVASYLVLFAMIITLIALPMAVLLWLSRLMNKDRYIFSNAAHHLYRLDSMTGKIHVAHGNKGFVELPIHGKQEENIP